MLAQLNNIREQLPIRAKLYYRPYDLYARYGLQHFITKYNFSTVDFPGSADIIIGGSAVEYSEVKDRIFLSPAKPGRCLLHLDDLTIPFFKRPEETRGDRSLVMAEYQGQVYPCVAVSANRVFIGFDIFAEIGRILAGYYDEHFLKSDLTGKSLKATPVVDALEECVFSAIKLIRPDLCRHPGFAWPEGRKFAMVLTHDVDHVYKTHQYLYSLISASVKADLPGLCYHAGNMLFKHGKNNPFWTFDTVSTIEHSLGVRSSFYFLQETGRINPLSLKSWMIYHGRYNIRSAVINEAILRLNAQGYEIGVHGSYNSFKNLALLRKEKELIQSITRSEIAGIRQHHLNYDSNITPGLHLSCGFKYDTSIGFKPKQGIGFRRGTSFPFPIMTPEGKVLPLVELPLIIMDAAIGQTATAGECFNLMRQVEKYRGVFTILWHQNTLNKREYPLQAGLYETLIREALKRGAWIATAREVYGWIAALNRIIK